MKTTINIFLLLFIYISPLCGMLTLANHSKTELSFTWHQHELNLSNERKTWHPLPEWKIPNITQSITQISRQKRQTPNLIYNIQRFPSPLRVREEKSKWHVPKHIKSSEEKWRKYLQRTSENDSSSFPTDNRSHNLTLNSFSNFTQVATNSDTHTAWDNWSNDEECEEEESSQVAPQKCTSKHPDHLELIQPKNSEQKNHISTPIELLSLARKLNSPLSPLNTIEPVHQSARRRLNTPTNTPDKKSIPLMDLINTAARLATINLSQSNDSDFQKV